MNQVQGRGPGQDWQPAMASSRASRGIGAQKEAGTGSWETEVSLSSAWCGLVCLDSQAQHSDFLLLPIEQAAQGQAHAPCHCRVGRGCGRTGEAARSRPRLDYLANSGSLVHLFTMSVGVVGPWTHTKGL